MAIAEQMFRAAIPPLRLKEKMCFLLPPWSAMRCGADPKPTVCLGEQVSESDENSGRGWEKYQILHVFEVGFRLLEAKFER